jgi:two-component system chemotaxis response regulator CheB
VAGRDLVVIGASAGGVEALLELARVLPADLPAAVVMVLHSQRHKPGVLPDLLERRGALPAAHAVDGEPIRPGRIYVAPPDYHLLVNEDAFHLARTATEHYTRPAIDPTFRTAARSHGKRVVGVLLTGMLGDGAMGLLTIHRFGGVTIVQDPADALYPQMPQNAVDHVPVDDILPLSEIGARLVERVRESREIAAVSPEVTGGEAPEKDAIEQADQIVKREQAAQIAGERVGMPAIFTCPECGGTLWQADEQLVQFRCHVGHLYAGADLLDEQADALESRLWEVLRYLVDQSILARQLSVKAEKDGRERGRRQFSKQAEIADLHAAAIREMLEGAAFRPPPDGAA